MPEAKLTDAEVHDISLAIGHYCQHAGTEDEAAASGCSECQLIADAAVIPTVERIITARGLFDLLDDSEAS